MLSFLLTAVPAVVRAETDVTAYKEELDEKYDKKYKDYEFTLGRRYPPFEPEEKEKLLKQYKKTLEDSEQLELKKKSGAEKAQQQKQQKQVQSQQAAQENRKKAFADAAAAYSRQDYKTALQLWLPFAEQDDADAQLGVSFLYKYGYGVPQDDQKALEWLRKASSNGNADARHYLESGW